MRALTALFIAVTVITASCNKPKCGCVPPPSTGITWKIVNVYGGISGANKPLTDAQKKHMITLRSDGSFTCINTMTSAVIDGHFTQTNFTSIYGDKMRIVFTPTLNMLPEEYNIVIEQDNTKILLGDNKTDGYITRLEPVY